MNAQDSNFKQEKGVGEGKYFFALLEYFIS
jgi:hypothetical protein